jgi:serine/threonine protein kinase
MSRAALACQLPWLAIIAAVPSATSYELLDLIGSGGMAELFRARIVGEQGFYKIVAIKRVLPQLSNDQDFVHMLVDEARTVSHLSHPNIAEIYELRRDSDGGFFIAMEFVPGPSLGAVLRKLGEAHALLPPACAIDVVIHVLEALDYAHRMTDPEGQPLNVIHRDVSPDNVLITRDGAVKLADFGLAKAQGRLTHTRQGTIKGKLAYMSPEQARGIAVDPRSDIFSAGLVLWEALTGRPHYDTSRGDLELMRSVVEGRTRSLAEGGFDGIAEMEVAVCRALAYEPAGRYARAADFARDLTTYHRRTWPDYSPAQLGAIVTEHFQDHFDGLADRLRRFSSGELRPTGFLRPMPTDSEQVPATEDERAQTVISRLNPLPSEDREPLKKSAGRRRPGAPLESDDDDSSDATQQFTQKDREGFGLSIAKEPPESWHDSSPPAKRRISKVEPAPVSRSDSTRRISKTDLPADEFDGGATHMLSREDLQDIGAQTKDEEEPSPNADGATRLVSEEVLQAEAARRGRPARREEKTRSERRESLKPWVEEPEQRAQEPDRSEAERCKTGVQPELQPIEEKPTDKVHRKPGDTKPDPPPPRPPPRAQASKVPMIVVAVLALLAVLSLVAWWRSSGGSSSGTDQGPAKKPHHDTPPRPAKTEPDAGKAEPIKPPDPVAGPDAGEPEKKPDHAKEKGILDIECAEQCDVYIENKKQTHHRVDLPPGKYKVKVVSRASKEVKQMTVDIAAGKIVVKHLELH